MQEKQHLVMLHALLALATAMGMSNVGITAGACGVPALWAGLLAKRPSVTELQPQVEFAIHTVASLETANTKSGGLLAEVAPDLGTGLMMQLMAEKLDETLAIHLWLAQMRRLYGDGPLRTVLYANIEKSRFFEFYMKRFPVVTPFTLESPRFVAITHSRRTDPEYARFHREFGCVIRESAAFADAKFNEPGYMCIYEEDELDNPRRKPLTVTGLIFKDDGMDIASELRVLGVQLVPGTSAYSHRMETFLKRPPTEMEFLTLRFVCAVCVKVGLPKPRMFYDCSTWVGPRTQSSLLSADTVQATLYNLGISQQVCKLFVKYYGFDASETEKWRTVPNTRLEALASVIKDACTLPSTDLVLKYAWLNAALQGKKF